MMSDSRYDRYKGDCYGDRWEKRPTGLWVVTWGDAIDWHNKPFTSTLCASEEVANQVVGEIVKWIVANAWDARSWERTVRHRLEACDGGFRLLGWRETRTETKVPRTESVTVDGQVYTRTVDEVVYGEWAPCKVVHPEGATHVLQISCYPQTVAVLAECGVAP